MLKQEPEGVGAKDTSIFQITKMSQDHYRRKTDDPYLKITLSQKQKDQWRGYVSSKLEANDKNANDKEKWRGYVSSKLKADDQENIQRVKVKVDHWLKETRISKKLQNKLERQADEKGLTGNQADKYIQKVERRMNRRKSD